MTRYSLSVLQAINDWQRGYSAKQKVNRVRQIEAAAKSIDPQFKCIGVPCYRQVALKPSHVWQMGATYRLEETVSSWTESRQVGKEFKGGVAPEGMSLLTVIFLVMPTPSQVVLNLGALYADPDFRAACERFKPSIRQFYDGIGKWSDSQHEVILQIDEVQLADVYACGGHSSKPQDLLKQEHVKELFGKRAETDRGILEKTIQEHPELFGPRWLTGAAKDRVLAKWVAHTLRLKAKYGR